MRWSIVAVAGPLAVAVLLLAMATSRGHHDPRVLVAAVLVATLAGWLIAVVPPSWGISAALALSMFGANWQNLGLPPSVAPDRFVLGFTLVCMVARTPGAGDRIAAVRFRPLYALMYIAGAYAIASAIAVHTITQHAAIFDLLDRMQILGWVVFLIAPCAFTTAADRRVLLATLVGMGVYLGLTCVFEILGPRALVFPRYIENPKIGIQFGRGRGPFTDATTNGLALYACMLASMIALRQWRSPVWRRLAMFTVALCAFGLLLTFQRTVWLGVGASALALLVFVAEVRPLVIRAAVVVAATVGIAFLAIPAVRHQASSRASDVATVRDRESLDTAAINMVQHHPLFGVGWETFQRLAPDYFESSDSYAIWPERPHPVHDVYLAIATELGLTGAALWLLILLIGVGGAALGRGGSAELRRWRLAVGALLVMWLAAGVSSPLTGSFPSLIMWLLAAFVTAPVINESSPGPPTAGPAFAAG